MGATVFFESSSELATLSNTFSVNSTPTDPTAVTLVVTDPLGVPTTYNWPTPADLTHGTPGVFSKDIACTAAGIWQYVWTGTGTASDVTAGTWLVHLTTLGQLYCTPEELKSRTGIADNLDDAEIVAACKAVSRWIEGHCKRRFYRATDTRTFVATNPYCLRLGPFNDLVSVTTLKTDSAGDGTFATTWTTGDYQLLPVNPTAAPEPEPYTDIKAVGSQTFPWACGFGRDDRVQIVGGFGWPAVPAAVREAAAIMVVDEVQLGGMKFGALGYAEYGPIRARANPIAVDLLRDYRLDPILVG